MSAFSPPIVVDLDGTLTPVDTLQEVAVAAAMRNPAKAFTLFTLFPFRKARAKRDLASIGGDYLSEIPLNREVVDRIQTFKGSQLVLCTASTQRVADSIANRLGFFTDVMASSSKRNLKGKAKAHALVERFGKRGFWYFGDSRADLAVWAVASKAFVVSNDADLVAEARKVCPEVEVLAPSRRNQWRDIARTLRPHQWVKNLLVFVPFLASHSFKRTDLLLTSLAAFTVFCLIASASYAINDVLDLLADRAHPTKRTRPLPAGRLDPLVALSVATLIFAMGLTLAFVSSPALLTVAGIYLVVCLGYSTWLKRVPFLDVTVLSLLYTLRLWAGTAVTDIRPSEWLTGFSLSLFLSLALCKRYVEYSRSPSNSEDVTSRRGYVQSHLPLIRYLGLGSMTLSVGVLAAYLTSTTVASLYSQPLFIAPVIAIVAFWCGRIWKLAHAGVVDDDPVVFALRDKVSWACLIACAALFVCAL